MKNKLTEKQIEKYFKAFNELEDVFMGKVLKLEKKMGKESGIEDIEFFFCDGEMSGIGNESRTMKLIHRK